MKFYIIAGEASGDLHGSNLVKELKLLDSNATIRAWGGDKMKAEGANIVKHYKDLAFMGFTEVLQNLPTILGNLKFCKSDILAYKPDVLILIDYPGFNLRIAKWAKQHGLKVVYYISPQVWAWKEGRVKTIKQCVDKMLVILPFEKQYYQKHGFEVEYVGHPLVEVVDGFVKKSVGDNSLIKGENIVAILPGSRKQEILKKLPIMLEVSRQFPEWKFIVAKAPGLEDDFYTAILKPYSNVQAVTGATYHLLARAKAAMVTSGTATLETALFGVPEVVCYKGSSISYAIAKKLVKIEYISLVNLIMNRTVVTELIQGEMNVQNVAGELKKLLFDEEKREKLARDYAELKAILSSGGNASRNAANSIIQFLNTTT